MNSGNAAFDSARTLDLARPMLRSVLAVVLGIVTLTVLSFAIEALTNPLLQRVFPNSAQDHAALGASLGVRAIMSAYGALSIAAGGYVTAWVARRAPIRHALAMGLVQAALTLYAMHALAGHAPARVWIMSAVMAVPAAWIGGLLRARSTRPRLASG